MVWLYNAGGSLISIAVSTTPDQSVPARTASSAHHSRSCTAVLTTASGAAGATVGEAAATEGVMTRSYPAVPPSHEARQRPRQSGLRARHRESPAARARSQPGGRPVG